MTPAQVIDLAHIELLTPAQRSFAALSALRIPWISQAALRPGAVEHHGPRLLPIAGTRETKMVHMLTVTRDYPPKAALVALIPEGNAWRAQHWANRPCPQD